MKIVPSIPPPVTVAEDRLDVKALTRVKPVKLVQERSLPPLVVQRHMQREAISELAGQQEKRHDTDVHGERRTYCRRTERLPVLTELRSGMDRRRHKQRVDDETEHVDEEV